MNPHDIRIRAGQEYVLKAHLDLFDGGLRSFYHSLPFSLSLHLSPSFFLRCNVNDTMTNCQRQISLGTTQREQHITAASDWQRATPMNERLCH